MLVLKINYLIIYVVILNIMIHSQEPPLATLPTTLWLQYVDNYYVPFQNGMPLPSFEKQKNSQYRTNIDLGGEWRKQRFFANHVYSMGDRNAFNFNNIINEANGRHLWYYDDSGWENKNLPAVENDWENGIPRIHYDRGNFNGGVWYRKHFNVTPDSDIPQFYKLKFNSVNYVCDIWLNDVYLGHHEGGYTPFSFDITNIINIGIDNVLAVRVDNPPIMNPLLPEPHNHVVRKDLIPYNPWLDWFNYTGIIQDVFIEVTNKLSVIRADVTPLNTYGNIKTRTILYNHNLGSQNCKLKIEIYDADINSINCQSEYSSDLIPTFSLPVYSGSQIITMNSQTRVVESNISIPNPRLWYPCNNSNDYANLYILKATILDANGVNVLDEYSSQFGIRKVEKSNNKMKINGKYTFLTGVARHEDYPVYGRSIPKNLIYNDLMIIRNTLKSNWLRTGHYPNHLYTYLIADRLGIATLEEVPVWSFNHDEAWNHQSGTIAYAGRELHYQMVREMFFRDFNRPSILCWSLTNENSPNTVNFRSNYIDLMKNQISSYFPDGRLIGQASAAYWLDCEVDDSQYHCDFSGWNLYVPNPDPITACGKQLNEFLDAANIYNNPLIGTDYNGERNPVNFNNRFDMLKNRAPLTESGGFNCNGFVSAITYWIGIDFYSTSSAWGEDPLGHKTNYGLLDENRNISNAECNTLISRYTPYFNMGGIYNGTLHPCDEELNKFKGAYRFELYLNYPNPFNPLTMIKYEIAKLSDVKIVIYNILGREVIQLINAKKEAGIYEISFDGSGIASGVYFYTMYINGNLFSSKKMLLLK